MFFLLYYLSLFEITEWGPTKRGAVWLNSFKLLKKTINAKFVSFLNLYRLPNAAIKMLYNFDVC